MFNDLFLSYSNIRLTSPKSMNFSHIEKSLKSVTIRFSKPVSFSMLWFLLPVLLFGNTSMNCLLKFKANAVPWKESVMKYEQFFIAERNSPKSGR